MGCTAYENNMLLPSIFQSNSKSYAYVPLALYFFYSITFLSVAELQVLNQGRKQIPQRNSSLKNDHFSLFILPCIIQGVYKILS